MEDLQHVIKGEVDGSDATRKKYSRDASIFEVMPQGVLYPKDITDLQAIIRTVSKARQKGEKVSVTARNGGTCMSGGSLTEGYIIDMSRHFTHVGTLDKHARSLWVQGGVMHTEIEKATQPHGLLFAPYTSSRDICGIGGMLGNNASGERSVKYGPTSSNVNKVKVMLADGEVYEFGPLTAAQVEKKKQLATAEGKIYREITKLLDNNWYTISHNHPKTKKNAAGYALWNLWDEHRSHFNLAKLFVGSQGTLGIITEAELKLVPLSKAHRMIVVPISDLHDLTPVVKTLLEFDPEVCETFDHHTYELAEKLYPQDANRAIAAKGQHMIVFGIYAGDAQTHADKQASRAADKLSASGRTVHWIEDPAAVESFLLIRRKSFRMLLENPTKDYRAMAFLEDTIVPLEHYGEFLAALESILADYDMTYTYAGHIGDGSIRLVPLVNMEQAYAAERVMELEKRVNELVFAFGGSMSVDHNDGIIRTPFLEEMYGHEMNLLFKRVKHLFDPEGVFNPGKKVGGTYDYAVKHIITSNI